MKSLWKQPKLILIACVALTVLLVSIYVVRTTGIGPAEIKNALDATIDTVSQYPILAFLAILIAGGAPIPLSPFLILAGGLYNRLYGMPAALGLCYAAMTLAMVWTYFVSAYPMHRLFQRVISLFAAKMPEIPEAHQTKLALILRITPGIPFFLQNYALGVARVPFKKYLLISMGIQLLYTPAFVIGGGAIFEGKAGLAIAAVSILIIMAILLHWLRSRQAQATGTSGQQP